MKLATISLVTALSAAVLCPAFAAGGGGGGKESQGERDAFQSEAVHAGGSDEERAKSFNSMSSERQQAWTKHCKAPPSDDTAERKAFCKAAVK